MEYLISFEKFNRMNDHFVKFIFMNEDHKNLLISLINSITVSINLSPIVDVKFKDREFNKNHHEEKGGSVDILCLGSDHKLYNIEFQNEKLLYFVNKVFYYMARILVNIKAGDDYDKLKSVCNIAILNHKLFTDLSDNYYFQPFRYQHQIITDYYLPNSSLFFIEIPKWEIVKPEIEKFTDLDVFLAFFSAKSNYDYLMKIAKRSEIMAQLMDLQDEYRRDYDLLQGYKTAEDYERDFRSIINTNREEAKEEGKEEVAIKMLKKNKLISEIIEFTGISSERINEIKATLQ